MEREPTLSEAMAGSRVPFSVRGTRYQIRQPTTEEYDDAMAVQRLWRAYWMAQPELQRLQELPCTDQEVSKYQIMIDQAQELFEELQEGDPRKAEMAKYVVNLQAALEGRTLAQETAANRATLARDRWLCQRLLEDEQGQPMVDTSQGYEEAKAQWESIPLGVKNASRPAIWRVLAMVEEAPFG